MLVNSAAAGEAGAALSARARAPIASASSSSCIPPTAAGRATAAPCSCAAAGRRNRHRPFPLQRLGQVSRTGRRTAACRKSPPGGSGKRLFHARVRRARVRARRRRHRRQRPRHAAHHRGVLPRPDDAGPQSGPGPRASSRPRSSEYLGVTNVFWLAGGVVGDDTHGHVDDICRFVNPEHRGAHPRGESRTTSTTARWRRTGSASRTCAWRTARRPEVVALPMPGAALLRRRPPAGELRQLLHLPTRR